ncbi:MAG: HAD-IC family P-type ATPase, partial [Desulfobacterales bacterium]|nr:HAD-IC family P-type ATPase [Desulfobacterales bacterium]
LESRRLKRIIMLTGDNRETAANVAEELGIQEYYAQVLPDEKTQLIKDLKSQGHVVAMVGDGINDSAALISADVGVSMKHGADIAREACDVMLTGQRLDHFIDAMDVSKKAMARVRNNFIFIVVSNTLFIGLGITGLITPALMALLHNLGTVMTCATSIRPVLPRRRARHRLTAPK